MAQDYTALFKLRAGAPDLDGLLRFQRAHGLEFTGSSQRWVAHGALIAAERAELADWAAFASEVSGPQASRSAQFRAHDFGVELGLLDHAGIRYALLSLTESALDAATAAWAKRHQDLLQYLAALSAQLNAQAFALGVDLDVESLLAFVAGARSDEDGEGVCIASGVPLASERAMRAHARVRELHVHGQPLLFAWLPGLDSYFA